MNCSTAHCCRAFGLPAHLGRREGVQRLVIGRMHRDELTLQMGCDLGDLDAVVGGHTLQLVAIGLAFGRRLEIDETGIPSGNLHALVAEIGRPTTDRGKPLNGASSPANWARKIAGPLIDFMDTLSSHASRRRASTNGAFGAPSPLARRDRKPAHRRRAAQRTRGGAVLQLNV